MALEHNEDLIFRDDEDGITVTLEHEGRPHETLCINEDGLLDDVEMGVETAIAMAVAILQTAAPWKLK